MWSGCRQADPVVSQAYPGILRYVLAFVHLRPLVHIGKRDFGKNDVVAASSSCRARGGKTSMMGIQ